MQLTAPRGGRLEFTARDDTTDLSTALATCSNDWA